MTDPTTISRLLTISCLTGFIGDATLQLLVRFTNMGGKTGWGLKEYFHQHGSAESVFIAGGMMTIFYVIYLSILGLPVVWYYLGLYGLIIDIIFRKTMLFPSLKAYYRELNYFWSGFWGAVPMMMPLGIMWGIDRLT